MPTLTRSLDKFNGVKLCDMTTEELNEFLGGIAERGAYNALSHVGLNDENAGLDVKDLRSLLTGYRVIRRTAVNTTLSAIGRAIGWIMVFGFIYMFMRNTDIGQLALKTIIKE